MINNTCSEQYNKYLLNFHEYIVEMLQPGYGGEARHYKYGTGQGDKTNSLWCYKIRKHLLPL
jgi:hypothetical protein